VAGTWTVGAAVHADDAHAVSLLLEALDGATGEAAREATEALPDAAAEASPDVVAALLAAGADPAAYDGDRGLSALRRAVRAGRNKAAALLVSRGAPDDSRTLTSAGASLQLFAADLAARDRRNVTGQAELTTPRHGLKRCGKRA